MYLLYLIHRKRMKIFFRLGIKWQSSVLADFGPKATSLGRDWKFSLSFLMTDIISKSTWQDGLFFYFFNKAFFKTLKPQLFDSWVLIEVIY